MIQDLTKQVSLAKESAFFLVECHYSRLRVGHEGQVAETWGTNSQTGLVTSQVAWKVLTMNCSTEHIFKSS